LTCIRPWNDHGQSISVSTHQATFSPPNQQKNPYFFLSNSPCVWCGKYFYTRTPRRQKPLRRSGRLIVCVDYLIYRRTPEQRPGFLIEMKSARRERLQILGNGFADSLSFSQTPWAAHTPIDVTQAAVNASLFIWSTWWRNSLLSITPRARLQAARPMNKLIISDQFFAIYHPCWRIFVWWQRERCCFIKRLKNAFWFTTNFVLRNLIWDWFYWFGITFAFYSNA